MKPREFWLITEMIDSGDYLNTKPGPEDFPELFTHVREVMPDDGSLATHYLRVTRALEKAKDAMTYALEMERLGNPFKLLRFKETLDEIEAIESGETASKDE